MTIHIRKYTAADLPDMIGIWNDIVDEGIAFPQEDLLTSVSGAEFFAGQTIFTQFSNNLTEKEQRKIQNTHHLLT